jgi:hypothetical protein
MSRSATDSLPITAAAIMWSSTIPLQMLESVANAQDYVLGFW